MMLTCFTVLMLLVSTYLVLEYYSFRKASKDNLLTLGRIIASNSSAALAFDSPEDAIEILSALESNTHILAACLYDKDGHIFAQYSVNALSTNFPTVIRDNEYLFEDGTISVFHPVMQSDKKLGTLFIKSDLEAMYAQLRQYAFIGLLLILGSLTVAFILSKFLQKTISEPIIALERTAKVISEQHDYSVRATQYGEDEIGALTKAFNLMLIQIHDQNKEILSFNQKLELIVKERTLSLREANEKLETLNSELLKSNRDLEQFAYIASHDLQEPLRKIQTFIQLLEENLTDPAKQKTFHQKISQSASRMQDLIKDVLNFSRISKSDEPFVDADLNSIMENLKSDFELVIRDKGAVINHPPLPVIKGIPLQLSQLFSNIISNSLKYNDQKPVINISFEKLSEEEIIKNPRLKENVSYIKIQFADNGIGFEPQFSDQIFNIFQRLHGKQAYSGTGIGLALCKKIVENHYGIIHAHGVPQVGATFSIILPSAS